MNRIYLCAMMLAITLSTFAQDNKELQAAIDQLNAKVNEQAITIKNLQSQLDSVKTVIASLQKTDAFFSAIVR